MKELEQGKERLQAESTAAFGMWQDEISEHYALFRDAVSKLALFDCLQSLAIVAASPGYVKPNYLTETCLRVEGCRHPMVRKVYVAKTRVNSFRPCLAGGNHAR
jgi:DNA mismatch repair protein MSH3